MVKQTKSTLNTPLNLYTTHYLLGNGDISVEGDLNSALLLSMTRDIQPQR